MKKTLFLFAFVAICGAGLYAQSYNEGQSSQLVLDLDTAIEIALSENATIQVADMEIERKTYARQETAANLYPSLAVSGQYSHAIEKQKMSNESGFSMGADNMVTISAQLNVPLFVPSLYPALRLSRMDIDAAVESARSSRISLVNEVKKAYYNLLLAEQSLQVLLASQSNIQQTVDNMRTLFENQLESEYNLITAEVQLSNLQPSIMQIKSGIEVSALYLKMLLQLPEDTELQLSGTLESFSEVIENSAIDYSADVSENSNLKLLDIQESMIQQQIRVINAGRLPVVSAFFTATAYGNDYNLDFSSMLPTTRASSSASGSEFWWQYPMSAGVNISIPVFNGFSKNKQVKQARTSLSQLQIQRDYIERQLRVQAQTNISSLLTARESMIANQRTMEQANKAYSISLTRFNNGLGTILELNSAELALTQARLAHSQSIYNYLAAFADYEMSIGADHTVAVQK